VGAHQPQNDPADEGQLVGEDDAGEQLLIDRTHDVRELGQGLRTFAHRPAPQWPRSAPGIPTLNSHTGRAASVVALFRMNRTASGSQACPCIALPTTTPSSSKTDSISDTGRA
jgi:hypothetical protein